MRTGYELLETVSFKVDVAPIRDKLKRMSVGTSMPSEQPSQSQRRSSRTRKGNPRIGIKPQAISRSSPLPPPPPPPPPSPENDRLSDGTQELASYYFWVDYQLEVEFKDGLMNYQLLIKKVDRSFTGQVNLASILEPWAPEDD